MVSIVPQRGFRGFLVPRRLVFILLLILLGVLLGILGMVFRFTHGPILYISVRGDAPPLAVCTDAEVQTALAALPPYQPSDTAGFARLQDGHFTVNGERFPVRGVNYFPVYYPWRRFLTESDLDAIDAEFALFQAAGLNTIRTFLWYQPMFSCPGSGALPVADVFTRLDGLIHAAAAHDLRIILTLNDTPDLVDHPLYANPAHTQAQTAFIVERYRDEAAILMWDVRNEGDIDYGTRDGAILAKFPRQQVLDWVGAVTEQVRRLDSNHLITAGWLTDAAAPAPYVDVVSFHHWWDADDLRQRIDEIRAASDRPVLLEEFGYPTFPLPEVDQAAQIRAIIETAVAADLAGWLIWTAFDFPLDATCLSPACPDVENREHHFGIWHSDYTPKPAAAVVTEWFGTPEPSQ
ncbi:MAG: cellulase family glycosylhydrolase [Anaerolineaceae bacterium]|nr:cellulase family glycosylhydrolase [Anaerolineaceae bacterium]